MLSSGTADYDDMVEKNGILVAEDIAQVGDTLKIEGRAFDGRTFDVETVVLLSQHRDKSTCLDERGSRQIEMQASRLASLLAQKPDDTIEIDLDLDELDATSAELKATYQEIKDYVLKELVYI